MNHKFSVFLLLIFSNWSVYAQKDEREICGTLVDAKGRTIEKARVWIESNNAVPSDILYTYESDNKGRFCLPVYARSGTSLLVMTSFPIPADSIPILEIPVNVGILKQRMSNSLKKVVVQRNKKIDIGSVKVLLRYSVVNFEILKPDGSPAYTSHQDWKKLFFQLFDSKGRQWIGTSISDEEIACCVDKEMSRIRLSVPDGKWSLQAGRATIENSRGVKGTFFTSPLITINFDKKKQLLVRVVVK
jgi:hypothetical protein